MAMSLEASEDGAVHEQSAIDPDSFRCLRFEWHGVAPTEVLVVTIDHPASERNAVDEQLHTEFAALFAALRRERRARAIVLTGSKKAFSAGGDYEWFKKLRNVEHLESLRLDAKQLIWDLLDCDVPIVAALNGHAVGLGASIALLCDALVMSEAATILDPHVRVGVVAGDGGTAIWPLALGPMLAKRYLLTGDPVTADEAFRLGLATHVVPAEDVQTAALAFASRLADGAPLALRYTKLSVNKLVKDALNTAFDVAMGHELITFLSADHAEAIDAIQAKRTPRFEGR